MEGDFDDMMRGIDGGEVIGGGFGDGSGALAVISDFGFADEEGSTCVLSIDRRVTAPPAPPTRKAKTMIMPCRMSRIVSKCPRADNAEVGGESDDCPPQASAWGTELCCHYQRSPVSKASIRSYQTNALS